MVNTAQTSASHRATNKIALKVAIKALRGTKSSMTASTEDKINCNLHEGKCAIKTDDGNVTS